LVVTTLKSSASAVSSMFAGWVEAAEDDAGSCACSLAALAPLWEQYTSATKVTFWLPEGHVTGGRRLTWL
jgi:hypothetical protein